MEQRETSREMKIFFKAPLAVSEISRRLDKRKMRRFRMQRLAAKISKFRRSSVC